MIESLIVVLKIAAVPAAITGLLAGRTFYRSHRQLKHDIKVVMEDCKSATKTILNTVTPKQSLDAQREYYLTRLSLNHPNRLKQFKILLFVKPNLAAYLFATKTDIDTILSNNSVFLNENLRTKLMKLRRYILKCETAYQYHTNKFTIARCYHLLDKINVILKLVNNTK